MLTRESQLKPWGSKPPQADDACLQTIRDGKSIIIEGLHLDPGLYLHEFGKYGISHLHTRHDSMLPGQQDTGQQEDAVLVEPVNPEPMNPDTDVQRGAQLEPDDRYAVPQKLLSSSNSVFIKLCCARLQSRTNSLGVNQSPMKGPTGVTVNCLRVAYVL